MKVESLFYFGRSSPKQFLIEVTQVLANVLSAGFGAIAAVVVFLMHRQDRQGRWFLLFAVGFAILAYEILTIGREWPISVGVVSLAVAMIAVLTDASAEREA